MKNKFHLETVQEKSYLNDSIFHHKTFIKNENVHGYGTSTNKSISILKSINEAVERYYFKEVYSKLGHETSNGLSCNSNEERAIDSAKFELIERHLLLTHWFQKISPYWLSTEQVLDFLGSGESCSVLKIAELYSYNLKVGIIGIVNNVHVVIAAVKKNNITGYAIATSADINVSIAVSKCLEDSIRVMDLIEGRLDQKQDIFKILTEVEVVRPADHLEFYLDPKNWTAHDWFFKSADTVRKYIVEDISTSTIYDTSIPAYHVYIACAKSEELQKLFFGRTQVEFLTKNNKENFKNKCIHPLA